MLVRLETKLRADISALLHASKKITCFAYATHIPEGLSVMVEQSTVHLVAFYTENCMQVLASRTHHHLDPECQKR